MADQAQILNHLSEVFVGLESGLNGMSGSPMHQFQAHNQLPVIHSQQNTKLLRAIRLKRLPTNTA